MFENLAAQALGFAGVEGWFARQQQVGQDTQAIHISAGCQMRLLLYLFRRVVDADFVRLGEAGGRHQPVHPYRIHHDPVIARDDHRIRRDVAVDHAVTFDVIQGGSNLHDD